MTLSIPLQPQQKARLLAAANARGVAAEAMVQQAVETAVQAAIDHMAADESIPATDTSPHDTRPIWQFILDNLTAIPDAELEKLPRDGASQHDHYLYGSPKRFQQ